MTTPAQKLARQRIYELRKRQTAFNDRLNGIVHRLRAPGDPDTDKTPDQWADLWATWQAAEVTLQAIADGLAPPLLKPARPTTTP